MHQTPRVPIRSSSPATSPQSNPARVSNPVETTTSPRRSIDSNARDASSRPSTSGGERSGGGPSRDSIKKLDQIIQNVYSKASTVILQERMQVTPLLVGRTQEKRTSRWFQLDTDDIDDFRDEFRIWKQCDGFDNRPPPLVIETYLDTSRLRSGQSLVITDDNGKRWDVVETINSSDQSSDSDSSRSASQNSEVVLERWKVDLRGMPPDSLEDFGSLLPTVYKKAIVLFRSLYTTTGFLPAWKLARSSKTKGVHPAVQVRCRVATSESQSRGFDPLRAPLFESRGDVTTDYMFGQLEVPVGRFYVSVSYRNSCNFAVVETESLLNSRIGIAISDDMFKPSLPHRGPELNSPKSSAEVGSLPYHRHVGDVTDNQQRYGSLSTFHGDGPLGTSPISALRQIKAPGSDTTGSPPEPRPVSVEGPPPNSVPIRGGPARRPSLRSVEGAPRRPSVSFQSSPFKAGSLSGSPVPRTADHDLPSSPHSMSRPAGPNALTHTRNRSSLTAGMPASLRGGPPASTENPAVGSPRPAAAGRFSSSFTHRRNRPSLGGGSRVGDDDQNSSGKQSLSSSTAQPGSGLLNETSAGASPGSFQTDDDSIRDFLKALESKRTLQSFEAPKKGDAATKKTTAQLSKFQMMRDSNNALTESMNSSMQMQRSSSSSRQPTNVPPISTSTSPGKPLSPHTPHTPAVPSRLSENSSADYATVPARTASRPRNDMGLTLEEEHESNAPVTQEGTTAIDIPMSPRTFPHARRSSSVAHQARVLIDEDDHRSISVGANEGETPSLSALLGRHQASGDDAPESPVLQPPAEIQTAGSADTTDTAEREARPPGALLSGYSSSPYGRRYGNSAGRGITPPQSGSTSLVGSSTGRYGRGYSRGGGTSGGMFGGATGDDVEEEPLLFDMSELNRDGPRRSLEENRGGGFSGSGGGHRGGY